MSAGAENGASRLVGKSRLVVWGAAAALMVLPVLALRAAEGAIGNADDFMFLAVLVAGVGLAIELAARIRPSRAYAAAAGFALAAAFLGTWINLAVGIVGSENNSANLIYAGPIGVAAVGTLVARLRPLGMARAMLAAAGAQVLVFATVLAAGLGFTGPITVFFTTLWLLSASLFREAAREGGRDAIINPR